MSFEISRRAALAGIAGLATAPAWAQLRIDITRGRVEPLPIAVSPFAAVSGENPFANDLPGVVSADLERSGLFRPINPSAFIQTPEAMRAAAPRFADWRAIGAQALVTGVSEVQRDGRLRVEFRLWDLTAGTQMEGQLYTTPTGNWRRIAHIIADAIYKRLTGEDGYFDTRIVFVAETGPLNQRVKRLAIMDQDSANLRYLTDGRALVLTPRFSPSTQDVTYLAFENNRPRVYLLNIDSGQRSVIGEFTGMTFAPRFAPDGNSVVLSQSTGGNTDIWSLDLRSRARRQLTDTPGIDTAPCFSPDGRQIVFESDRGGSQQLYVMDSGGGGARRISFGQGRYATPVWSPRGDMIAFTRQGAEGFAIGVMRPDGSGERIIATGFLVESPTWAPNGRVIAFYRQQPSSGGQGGGARLFSVDVTGFNERQIRTPTDASDPAWSPLIP